MSKAKKGGTSYIFVTDGIEAALKRAREAAGPQDVRVNGGADVAQQFLNAGLLDEIRLHLVPIIMGTGTRLFDGVRSDVRLVPRNAQTSLRSRTWFTTSGVHTERVARSTWPTRGDSKGLLSGAAFAGAEARAHPLTLDEKLWGNRPTACDIAVQITVERRSTHPLPVLHDHCSGLL